jgi:hypothetical protein
MLMLLFMTVVCVSSFDSKSLSQNHLRRDTPSAEVHKTDPRMQDAFKSERNFFLADPEPTVIKNMSISRHTKYFCNHEYFPIDITIKVGLKDLIDTTAFLDRSSVELQVEQKQIDICRRIIR